MKTKKEIVDNWLPRYTGKKLDEIGKYILLTNFQDYVERFARKFEVPVEGTDKNMPSATAEGITMINFGMGSPNAATVMDLLSAIHPKAVLFLGKCGGLKKKNQLGDFILPIAAIRSDGTSADYLPPKFRHYQLLTCSVRFRIFSEIRSRITGQALFLQRTAGFGNTTIDLKNTSKKHGQCSRYGDSNPFHRWFRQPNTYRRFVTGFRSAYDLYRSKNRQKRSICFFFVCRKTYSGRYRCIAGKLKTTDFL